MHYQLVIDFIQFNGYDNENGEVNTYIVVSKVLVAVGLKGEGLHAGLKGWRHTLVWDGPDT